MNNYWVITVGLVLLVKFLLLANVGGGDSVNNSSVTTPAATRCVAKNVRLYLKVYGV